MTPQGKIRQPIQLFRAGEKGAVAVEFALIAPLLIALVFGTISFGYLFGVSHSVQQLAAEAARVSVKGLEDDEREELAKDYIINAKLRYPLLRQDAISWTVDVTDGALADVQVTVIYAVDGSLLELANSLFGLGISEIVGRAYLAY
ncbi:TadE/TadG family type IV pilus assembly protein [Roseinatronobacter sp. S2]|uniref:TadE/TadG family type IV pilus assembly protein n=1 Tax=Roseinatronobacter sp. S2 TaxID=3035471 RepID=UPI00240F6539|nr:TadE/TadG family type IV pilus assembly protein [Roseinatronobacter sp. S2]WFE77027.1 pilus assembly protein [Roseinatronobacter sp. S2]